MKLYLGPKRQKVPGAKTTIREGWHKVDTGKGGSTRYQYLDVAHYSVLNLNDDSRKKWLALGVEKYRTLHEAMDAVEKHHEMVKSCEKSHELRELTPTGIKELRAISE